MMDPEAELMASLVGKTIREILVSDDDSTLVLATDQGDVILVAEGDCCSECWFADLLGVPALLGHPILKVEGIDLPDYNTNDGRGRQDVDSVYSYKFTTARGHADLIFRNSSNGYYGGGLTLGIGRPPRLKPITADWSA